MKKNSKRQSQIAACEQKNTAEKPNFCSNTVFSLYFKIRAKKIHAAKPLAFSLHFLFRRDQNHHSDLTSKIMKMCEQKKRQRPNTIQILSIVKNQEHRKIATLSLQLRSYKNHLEKLFEDIFFYLLIAKFSAKVNTVFRQLQALFADFHPAKLKNRKIVFSKQFS